MIDWSNAAVGVTGLDAANTWLTLAAGRPDGSMQFRLRDPNLSDGERATMQTLVDRVS